MPVRRPEELAAVRRHRAARRRVDHHERLLETFELLEPLRARLAEGLPAYGSCAGMILLADKVLDGRPDQQQLGGLDMIVRRNAFGRQVDSFEEDLDFAGRRRRPGARGVHQGAVGRVGRPTASRCWQRAGLRPGRRRRR